MKELEKITPLEKDFGQWFIDVIRQGSLIEYGPVKGTMVFKPISYGLWENIRKSLDNTFQKVNVENVYLPLLIPLSYLQKEKEHVKGFAPELATITKVGDRELPEHVVIRPTSEMLFGELFQKIVNSHNDLPIIYNQWANVLRWEKKTQPFLRNSEFLWQEGHTVHSKALEARKFSRKMVRLYQKFLKEYLAIPVVVGKKTPREKFAGAVTTYTIEAMMKDGKALQSGTSHYLGQNFAKAMNIKFQDNDNKVKFVYQTSWGVSTRLIGGIIMTHGDNRGIVMPPKVAPNQIDIIEIFGHKNEDVRKASNKLEKILSRKYRVRVDRSTKGPGFKASKSEIEGTPIRIEIGPRDIKNNEVTIIRRDTLDKKIIKLDEAKSEVATLLIDIHNNLYKSAQERLEKNIVHVDTYEQFKEEVKNMKFVLAPFAGNKKQEKAIQDETTASARCVPFAYKLQSPKKCIITGKETKRLVLFAKAY